jgi:hypothetical protein
MSNEKSNENYGSTYAIPNTKTSLTICFDGTRIWKSGSKIIEIKDVLDHSLNLQDCQLCWILLSTCSKATKANEYDFTICSPPFLENNILSTRIDPDVFVSQYNSGDDWEDVNVARNYFQMFQFYGTNERLITRRTGATIGKIEHIHFADVPTVGEMPEKEKPGFTGLQVARLSSCFFADKVRRKSAQSIAKDAEFIECIRYGTVR